MSKITNIDNNGVHTRPLPEKEFGYDNYVAGGDLGRVSIGTSEGGDGKKLAFLEEVEDLTTVVNGKANTPDVVALAGTQTVTGDKTFSGTITVPTQATDDNSTKAASTAFVQQEIVASVSTALSTVAAAGLLSGELTISGGDLTHTGLSFGYTLGKNADGSFNTTTEQVTTGSYDLAALDDGVQWIAREYGTGNLVTFDQRPSISPLGGAVWFNTEDGKWYQNPFVIEADGSLNSNIIDAVPDMTSNVLPSGEVIYDPNTNVDAWYAFTDDAASSYWNTLDTTGYVGYKFTESKVINKFTLTGVTWRDRDPKNFNLEGSNTGLWSGEETIIESYTDTVLVNGVSATFTTTNSTAFTYYRINVTENGGGLNTAIGEIEFIEAQEAQETTETLQPDGSTNTSTTDAVPTMTSNTAPLGIASASSEFSSSFYAYKLFDGSLTTAWETLGGQEENCYVQYEYPTNEVINKFSITAFNTTLTKTPKEFKLLASNTGGFSGEEVELVHLTNEISWGVSEKRYYTFSNDTAYKYYRLFIISNNGDGTYTEFAEWELISARKEVIADGTPLTNPISFISEQPFTVVSGVVTQAGDIPISTNYMKGLNVQGLLTTSENRYVQNIGMVSINDELVFPNLFGNENYEDCTVEIMAKVNGEWGDPGFTYDSVSYGVNSSLLAKGIVVTAGNSLVSISPNTISGAGFTTPVNLTAVECKIIVTYHGKTKET